MGEHVDDYILTNCHKSGEQLARELNRDGGTVRRRVRYLRRTNPSLPWYANAMQADAARVPHDVPAREGIDVATDVTVVGSDLHVPFHDPRAVGCFLGYIRDTKPNRLVLNGDIADFYALSKFSKNPKRELELQDELDATNDVLDALDSVMPEGSAKDFVLGNHCARLVRYLADNSRALHGLRALTLDELLHLTERGYNVVPMVGRDASLHVGRVEVGHFNIARKDSGASARALLLDRGCSVIQAHTHKLSAIYKRKRGTGEQIAAWEMGCLCDLNPEYVTSPDWQQGFATITTCSSGRYHVALHEILGGELLAGGRRY
jgi:hypothetical protein